MDFNSHASSCPNCYAPTNRFCAEGKRLRIEQDADYHFGELIMLEREVDRKAYWARNCKQHFDLQALRAAIKKKFERLESGAEASHEG